ncbi:Hpt domain-containing protein [Pseudomonas sp. NCCP-436]|uniref:Hpt domain-containing protein n=1 Tax=Pseudomonas sp. NCCP-436 TaxID=2842481 RepID=UPI001C808430|nr:Hpt domain-containing protein [Pseudomonas sp. NCCP-436]GIZ12438.1 hypothetical protein NCCP436_18540 [Pseudomonas sp. NCCP-436]
MDAKSPLPAALQEKLNQLVEQFASHLAEELPRLRQLAERLPASDATQRRQQMEQLRAALHRLAGSAGTFGFAQLSQRTREQELQLQHWLQSDLLQPAELATFVEAISQLTAHTNTSTAVQTFQNP